MRMRILAALPAALLVAALAPAAAMAAPDDPVPLKGALWTTMAEAPGPPDTCSIGGQDGVVLTIVENAMFNSTLTHLGLVTLVQHQCVVADPNEIQLPWGVPGAGLIQVLDATLTAANGDTLTFTTPAVPFEAYAPAGVDPDAGPLPIKFKGTLDIAGGTGRFASAEGSASFEGWYCFRVNGGQYVLAGLLTR